VELAEASLCVDSAGLAAAAVPAGGALASVIRAALNKQANNANSLPKPLPPAAAAAAVKESLDADV
jgi:hypothetical protein